MTHIQSLVPGTSSEKQDFLPKTILQMHATTLNTTFSTALLKNTNLSL